MSEFRNLLTTDKLVYPLVSSRLKLIFMSMIQNLLRRKFKNVNKIQKMFGKAKGGGILLMSILIMINSCSYKLLDSGVISLKYIPPSARVLGSSEGKDCAWIILWFFPTKIIDVEGAIKNALESYPEANVILNSSIYYEYFVTPLIMRHCYKVKGVAAEIKSSEIK